MRIRPGHRPLYTHLYFQVLGAIAIGVILGYFFPAWSTKMKPLGDGFIKLIKMMIAPIIFTTVVVGIAKMGDMKEVGRVGLKALIYFELVRTLALAIGLVVVNVVRPGAGINADVSTLDTKAIASYTAGARSPSTVDLLLRRAPTRTRKRSE
jgi:aerobic C4-dicarboxylate transport protein